MLRCDGRDKAPSPFLGRSTSHRSWSFHASEYALPNQTFPRLFDSTPIDAWTKTVRSFPDKFPHDFLSAIQSDQSPASPPIHPSPTPTHTFQELRPALA